MLLSITILKRNRLRQSPFPIPLGVGTHLSFSLEFRSNINVQIEYDFYYVCWMFLSKYFQYMVQWNSVKLVRSTKETYAGILNFIAYFIFLITNMASFVDLPSQNPCCSSLFIIYFSSIVFRRFVNSFMIALFGSCFLSLLKYRDCKASVSVLRRFCNVQNFVLLVS